MREKITEYQVRQLIREILIQEGFLDSAWSGIKSGAGAAYDAIADIFDIEKPKSPGILKTLDDLSDEKSDSSSDSFFKGVLGTFGLGNTSYGTFGDIKPRALIIGDSQAAAGIGSEMNNSLRSLGFDVVVKSSSGSPGKEVARSLEKEIQGVDLVVAMFGGNDSSVSDAVSAAQEMIKISQSAGAHIILVGPPPVTLIKDVENARSKLGKKIVDERSLLDLDGFAERRIDIADAIDEISSGYDNVSSFGIATHFKAGSNYPDQRDGLHCYEGADVIVDSILSDANINQISQEIKEEMESKLPGRSSSGAIGDFDYDRWISEIKAIESGGDYEAVNKDSLALGKYQFVPRHWWDEIRNFAGGRLPPHELIGKKHGRDWYADYQAFLEDPDLQEDWMRYYTETEALPEVEELRKDLPNETAGRSDGQLAGLYHFQGPKGARDWLRYRIMRGRKENRSNPDQYMDRIT